jgi:hypothetical protein
LTTSHLLAVKEFEHAPREITDDYDLSTLNSLNDTIQRLQEVRRGLCGVFQLFCVLFSCGVVVVFVVGFV